MTRQNARRHGATATADPEKIIAWLKVIVGNPDLPADVITSKDETHQLAVRLAEAEARLVAARQALDAFKADPDPINRNPEWTRMVEDVGVEWAFQAGAVDDASIELWIARAKEDFYKTLNRNWLISVEKRLLHRYLREASSRRNRIFKGWIYHLEQLQTAQK